LRNISFISSNLPRLDETPASTLCLFYFQEKRPLPGIIGLIDWRLQGRLSSLIIDDFISGELNETLLFPLGGKLQQDRLLLFGLGERKVFNRLVFEEAVKNMITTVDKLSGDHIITALPGRPHKETDAVDAIEWFFGIYDEVGMDRDVTIVEPSSAQKTMSMSVERWRLRQSLVF